MAAKAAVLIVDDDVRFIRALSVALMDAGYEVAGASDPREAVEYMVSGGHRFDAIVTDLQMPGLDGIGFLRTIKNTFPEVPVIVITAFGDLGTQSRAMEEGAFAFVNKPTGKQEFVGLLERAIQQNAQGAG